MVQSADSGYRHHSAQLGPLNFPRLWLFQGKERPGFVIIGKIKSKHSAQTGFVENDHMI